MSKEFVLLSAEQEELVKKAQLKSLITNDYLHDTSNENLILIADLFFANNIQRALKFNVWSNVFKTVADTFAFFTWTPNLAFDFDTEDFVKDFVWVWEMVIWLERVNWKIQPYYIDAEDYIFSDWEHRVFKYYQTIENQKTINYLLKQVYRVWQTENRLYRLDYLLSTDWTEVPLDTIPQTSNLSEFVDTWLDIPAILVYSKRDSSKVNQSEIDKIKNLWYSLDRKQVLFETQFLQEVDQYVLFENINFPSSAKWENGEIVSTKIGKKLTNNLQTGEKADIKFISNKNDLIDSAIDYEQKQLAKITSATSIPLDFLWLSTSWTTSWSSRTIMIWAFVKKVQAIRNWLDRILYQILELWNYENKEIIWDDVIPKSDKELAEELKTARESWFISQYTSIKKYLHLDTPEEIDAEIERINLESNNQVNENNETN